MTSHATPSNRLREERERHHWTQGDLAEKVGTAEVTIRRWEQGRQQPGAYYRLKLCALFGKSAEELGLLPTSSKTQAPLTSEASDEDPIHPSEVDQQVAWTVPYARNPYFTGREALLEQLEQQLFREQAASAEGLPQVALTQSQAIKGLGGIGKTQLAVEYAYRSRRAGRYQHVLWVDAATQESLLTSFRQIAELLPSFANKAERDQHKLIAAIKAWLQQCQEPWLLIFDNVEDLVLVADYCPQWGQGNLLFTTRLQAMGALACSLEVDQMGVMEGTELLLRRAQRQKISDEETNQATNIVIALDGLPLALDQAAAYIEGTGCGFADYLQLYAAHRQALLARRGTQITHYPDSVATTWALSFQRIEQANPAATLLLRLLAFLAPDRIPEELLRDGAMYWPLLLQKVVVAPLSFNQALETVCAYSLVQRLPSERLLRLHRLVQAVQRDTMEPDEQRLWAERVVLAVNATLPHNTRDVATWPQCLRCLEQAQVCDQLIQQYRFEFTEGADLLQRTGVYLFIHGLYTLAEPLYQRALQIWEQSLGEDHSQVASLLHNLANLKRVQGKYAEAESLYQRALQIWEQSLGPDHFLVAYVLNNLANLYYSQGKYHQGNYAKAEPLYQRAVRIQEQQLGPDHPDVAHPLNGLASLYREQGKYAEAESLYQRALQIWEQQLGPDYSQVAHPLDGLASLYREQGKYAEAESLYQRALQIWEQHLGEEHPNVAYPLHGLANLKREQGKYGEARLLYRRALCIREQSLGPEHLDTAETILNLAQLQEVQGDLQEAISLYRRALTTWEHALGTQHPKATETRQCLVPVLRALGQEEEAVQLEATTLAES